MNALDSLKETEATLRETEFPQLVIVETIAGCNLRCVMCPYPTLERAKGIMPFETFKKISDEMAAKGQKSQMWLAIMGEPTLMGQKLAEYVAYAKKAGVREVILNTNGTVLTPELARALHESGLDEIIFGIDANTNETYSKIRVLGNLDRTRTNILEMLSMAQKEGWKKPRIVCQLITMDQNRDEVDGFRKYWTEVGAVVKIRQKLGWGQFTEPEDLEIPADSPHRIPCPWIVRTMSIHHDGKIIQCDSDYEGKFPAGNIKDTTIEEAWNGELKRRRERHWSRKFDLEPCRGCKDWQVGLSLWYLPESPNVPLKTTQLPSRETPRLSAEQETANEA